MELFVDNFAGGEGASTGIEFTRAGVVQLPGYDLSFAVNGESIEEYIRSEVEKRRPAKDQYGNFAGKVTVRIEFLGDMEAE